MNKVDQPMNEKKHVHDETYYCRHNLQNLNHTTMVFCRNRPKESLNGLWHFTIDPYDTGLRADWHILDKVDANNCPIPWDYDANSEELIRVPSCWNLAQPMYHYYEGSAWYTRTFTYRPLEKNERVFLRVGGANYDTKVYLNETFLGNHYGGSTPFFVELTGHLQPANILQLCVNNTRTLDRVPMRNTDWFNYGGIYRDVELYRLNPSFIKDFFIYLVPDDQYNKLTGKVTVDGETKAGPVQIDIPELGIQHALSLQGAEANFSLEAAPELWSPENPKLYEVRVTYGTDQITDRVGFRQIDVRGTAIYLNGEEIYLRGVACHEDDTALGKVSTEADIRRRFAHAKELNCNCLRLAHYPHTERVAELADEAGLLLWEEIPVYWAIDFDNPATYQDAENQLLELIKRDRNRASVIIWSVGNENADTDERLAFMGRLARTAKQTDPSRLTSAACLVNHHKLAIEDRLAQHLDVIGLNEYYGWYDPDFNKLGQLIHNSHPDKPVIISEVGAGALAGHHGCRSDMFTEEYMAYVYEEQIKHLQAVPYVKGMTPWILYDFRAERRYNRFQKGYNRKGLIADDKQTKKLAFYVLQNFYADKKG